MGRNFNPSPLHPGAERHVPSAAVAADRDLEVLSEFAVGRKPIPTLKFTGADSLRHGINNGEVFGAVTILEHFFG